MGEQPEPPGELGEAGRGFWTSIVSKYDLDPHEVEVLHAACSTLDLIVELDGVVRAEGATLLGGENGLRLHPVVAELREQRQTFSRLVAVLRIPDADTGSRPQRRGGAGGPFNPRGYVSQ